MTSTVLLLAMLICGEHASSEAGMRLVANTVANRAEAWNMPIRAVITQPRAYYGLKSGLWERSPESVRQKALKIAQDTLNGHNKDATGGALYFRRPCERIRPWHKVLTLKTKEHWFYK